MAGREHEGRTSAVRTASLPPAVYLVGVLQGDFWEVQMLGRRLGAFCIVAACLATLSCQRLDNTGRKPTGPLAIEPAKFADAIPADYGPLIAVTENPADPAWVQLWFQKQDSTIVAISVNIEQGRISDRVLTIPRK